MAKAKYETHIEPYLDRIRMWVDKGASDREIAGKLGIAFSTLKYWKGRHPALLHALEAPRGDVDDRVEAALYKRCIGYDYEEVTMWQSIGRNGELVWLERRTKKHLPPDPNSIQFWLTNRRPKDWKRMPEVKETEADDTRGVIMMPEDKDG